MISKKALERGLFFAQNSVENKLLAAAIVAMRMTKIHHMGRDEKNRAENAGGVT